MAFDLRMRALHCVEQSGNSTSNSDQAIQFIPTHFADSERHLFRRRKMKKEMKPMKKLILSAALAALLTTPAFAQSYNAGYGSGNVIDQPALEHGRSSVSGTESFASVPPRASARHARNTRTEQIAPSSDPYAVYDESGDYAGRDPDPNIRFELHRDNARDE